MNAILEKHISAIQSLCVQYKVQSLYAFGSVCTERFTKQSDIDFLVSFHEMDYADYADTYFEFADNLEFLLETKIDLDTKKSLQNPYFISSIEQNKQLLYAS